MLIKVIRDKSTETHTLSELIAYVNGVAKFQGYGVEPPWLDNKPYVSCIPTGTYKAFTRTDSANGRVIELKDVPNRTHIQFHVGNWAHELKGCIAPGLERIKDGVLHSKDAMDILFELASDADSITVEIVDISGVPDFKKPSGQYGTIDPSRMPEWEAEMPQEWREPVSYSNTLAEFKSSLRKRFERRERAVFFFNFAVSVLSNRLKIPELSMLKIQKPEVKDMSEIDVGKKLQKVLAADGWEAVVWGVVAAAGLAGYFLTGQTELIVGAVAVGIKSGFQWYKAKADEEE